MEIPYDRFFTLRVHIGGGHRIAEFALAPPRRSGHVLFAACPLCC